MAGKPMAQGGHMDPKLIGKDVLKIFCPVPSEILAPSTPRMSLGTKIFYQNFFSYDVVTLLFYNILGYVSQIMQFYFINVRFFH